MATPTVVISDASDPKKPRTIQYDPVLLPQSDEKKSATLDDSRRLFQRLWTDEDEDEIELLQGFSHCRNRGSTHDPKPNTEIAEFLPSSSSSPIFLSLIPMA